MQIINQSNGVVMATNARLATSFWARLKGLLGRSQLPQGEALILKPCSSVHCCFMRFTIDVIFINQHNKVIHLQENMAPWRFSPFVSHAKAAIELPAGSIQRHGIVLDDTLLFGDKEVQENV